MEGLCDVLLLVCGCAYHTFSAELEVEVFTVLHEPTWARGTSLLRVVYRPPDPRSSPPTPFRDLPDGVLVPVERD